MIQRLTSAACKRRPGFTLTEVMIALSISMLAMTAALALISFYSRAWRMASVQTEAKEQASMAISRIVYGVSPERGGLRSASAMTISEDSETGDWIVRYSDWNGVPAGRVVYLANQQRLVHTLANGSHPIEIGRNVSHAMANLSTSALDLELEVGVARGQFQASQTLATTIRWRN